MRLRRYGTVACFLGFAAVGVAQSAWTGSINFNANWAISNQDTQSILLFSDASKKDPMGLLRVGVRYAFARQTFGADKTFETTEDNYKLSGRYDWSINSRLFAFGSLQLDHDAITDLDLRTVSAGGLGFIALQSGNATEGKFQAAGDAEWRLSAGLSYLTEDYDGAASKREVGLQFGSLYRRSLSSGFNVQHELVFVPAFSDFGDYFLTSDLSLRATLTGNLVAAFSWFLDYDATPASGRRKDNSKLALSLGYKF
jgi:putative salt-induced outer membrane protein YdiY